MTKVRCKWCGHVLHAINNQAVICPDCDDMSDDTEDE